MLPGNIYSLSLSSLSHIALRTLAYLIHPIQTKKCVKNLYCLLTAGFFITDSNFYKNSP
ncbi:hypothetical protein GA0061071_10952 [Kosakonia oryzendophytica]|uniref:Uncharacterized protein n=1 Tax=Kosakonia oryzendophytica TaxID=1005665 RepID=A0A1C4CWD2_9ENTR|nr:hypothetical protein DFO53_1375 [Enterobacter sp. AG5470]SCC23396.1 hypothetical protein GA0061071_10952 [Kosakonia oryzendophytica]